MSQITILKFKDFQSFLLSEDFSKLSEHVDIVIFR